VVALGEGVGVRAAVGLLVVVGCAPPVVVAAPVEVCDTWAAEFWL
jgi:hypothetical protein